MIPRKAHFVWLGRDFLWVHALAVRSAAQRGGFEQVVLHHDDDLRLAPGWPELLRTQNVEIRRLDIEALFGSLGDLGDSLLSLYRSLTKPAARSNVIRAALLAVEGGVYLDTDTITVDSFLPLLETGFFCGEERIALPLKVMRSKNPLIWLAAACQLAGRDLLRRLPDGWRWFRKIERCYPLAVNNAVMGAKPGHPFVRSLLHAMVDMPKERQRVRFALGTQLLEERVAADKGSDLTLHGPEKFYPLCPEISEHWFKLQNKPRLDKALSPNTVAVHWYASVRTQKILALIDPNYVRKNAGRQLFSALAVGFILGFSTGRGPSPVNPLRPRSAGTWGKAPVSCAPTARSTCARPWGSATRCI
jgi:hypothetical protein